MKIKIPSRPTYWYCPTCGKWDSPRVTAAMASPEHVSHRSIDIGTCKGTMIPLYSKEDIQLAND